MAATDLTKLLEVPGQFCADPTALSGAFPHGGTALGAKRAVLVQPRVKTREIEGVLTRQPRDVMFLGQSWRAAVSMRGFDGDAVSRLWPAARLVTGSSPARYVIEAPGTTAAKAGQLLAASKAFKLLFTPNDPLRHPALLLYRAIGVLEEGTEIACGHGVEFEWRVVFTAIPRAADGLVGEWGLLRDLVP